MKKIWLISCGVALMFIVATVLAADKKQTKPADAPARMEELARQVDSLRARIKELEQRLAKLEKTRNKPIASVAPPTDAPTILAPRVIPGRNLLEGGFADPSHPPKIWGEGQCNGWKFYTIPLSATGRGTAMPIPLSAEPLAAAR
jgi:hypothetical protein